MPTFHKTLERQIKKFLGEQVSLSPELMGLLQAVSDTYVHSDEDRALIERSLELSSKELSQNYKTLEEKGMLLKERVDELERLNRSMIGRELKMVELKARIAELGNTAFASSPADFAKLIADETEKWGKVIRAANIKAE